MSRSPYDLELALKVLVHIPDHSPMKRLQVQSDCRLPPCTKTKLNQFRIAIWDDDQTCCPVDSNIKSAIKLLVDKLKDIAECHHVYQDRPLTSKYGWKGGSKYAFEIYQQLLATEENLGIDPELIETARDILRKRKKNKKDEENNDHLTPEKSTQQKLRDRVIQQTEWIVQSTQSWNVANNERQKMRTTYEKFFQEYDVLICPITASVAWPKDESSSGCHEWSTDRKTQLELIVGSSRMDEDDDDDDDCNDDDDDNDNNNNNFKKNVQHFWKIGQRIIPGANGHQTPYHDQVFWSGVTNICGNPSTVFPAGQAKVTTQEGTNHHHHMMPIGLQVVGSEWNDFTTIAFTKALEKELGYKFIPPNGYD